MILTDNQLKHLSDVAVEAALKAGVFIESNVNKGVEAQKKDGGESLASQVVTEVDIKSQEIVLSYLETTLLQYDLGLLTEESEDNNSRFDKDYFWCVDPLDGTLPFIEGVAGYAVCISLISKTGVPVIGVIYNPRDEIMYHAIKGQGAFRNNTSWMLKDSDDTFTFLANRSLRDNLDYDQIVKKVSELGQNNGKSSFNHVVQAGAAMSAMWGLEHAPAVYFALPKKAKGGGSLWDYSASACIYNELTAFASDVYGNPLDLNRPDSCFLNHRGVLYATNKKLVPDLINLIQGFNHLDKH